MSALVAEDSLFGGNINQQLMPTVFVERITLSSGSDPIVKDDPHIDHEWEGKYVKDRYGTRKITYPGFSLARKSNTGDALAVTVDLVVKDKITDEITSSWFYDETVLKYMKIRIIQSRDKGLSAELVKGNISALQKPRYKNRFEQQYISLQKNDQSLENFYSVSETGRELVSSIPYRAKFFSKNSEPEHLAYYVFCYFDIAELSQDYDLDLYGYDYQNGIISNFVTYETAIDNYKLVSESHIYYTPDGKIWAGPVHQRQGAYMAGIRHTSQPHPMLTRETTINGTVQDFRNIQQNIGTTIDMSPIRSIIGQFKDDYDSSDIKIEDSPAYFSEAFVTRGSPGSGTSHFVFSFNFYDFLRQESQFGNLMREFGGTDSTTTSQIKSLSKIKSLKVFRHRANPHGLSNNIGSPTVGGFYRPRPYDISADLPVLVVESADQQPLSLMPAKNFRPKMVVSSVESGEKVLVGSIREMNLKNASVEYRNFAITDHSVDDVTDGVYQYSVKVEVEDGAVIFVKNLLKNLQSSIQQFSLYYDLSSSPEFYDFNSKQFKDAFLQYFITAALSDSRARRTPGGAQIDFANSPWVEPLATFVVTLAALTDTISHTETASADQMYKQLFMLSNPKTGTPEGISAVLGLMGELETILESVVGTNKKVETDLTVRAGSTSSGKSLLLKAEKMFSSLYDSEVPNSYGLDFLGASDRNNFAGVKTITFDDYSKRLITENRKYFSRRASANPIPDISPLQTVDIAGVEPHLSNFGKYAPTYLTPYIAKNGKSSLMNHQPNLQFNKHNDFSIKYLNALANNQAGSFPVTKVSKTTNVEKVGFLGKLGISVMTPGQARAKEIGQMGTSIISSVKVMSDGSEFVEETIEYSNREVVIPMAGVDEVINIFSSDLSLFNNARLSLENPLSNMANQEVKQLSRSDFEVPGIGSGASDLLDFATDTNGDVHADLVERIPNQIKSIFYGGSGGIRKDYFSFEYDYLNDFRSANAFIWNYQVIAKVESFAGFQRTDAGTSMAAGAIWKPFDADKYEQSETPGGSLLCRLVMYNDSALNIGVSKYADIPYYDTYFFIAPNTAEAISRISSGYAPGVTINTSYQKLKTGGSRITNKLMRIVSSAYLRTGRQPRPPRNPGTPVPDQGVTRYHDPLRRSHGNAVIRLIEETGCVIIHDTPYDDSTAAATEDMESHGVGHGDLVGDDGYEYDDDLDAPVAPPGEAASEMTLEIYCEQVINIVEAADRAVMGSMDAERVEEILSVSSEFAALARVWSMSLSDSMSICFPDFSYDSDDTGGGGMDVDEVVMGGYGGGRPGGIGRGAGVGY